MGIWGSLFGDARKPVAIDLAKPYRDLLGGQTGPVVRGVLVHAVTAMRELENPDACTLVVLGRKPQERLAELQHQHTTYSERDTALAAIVLAVNSIMMRSAPKVFTGEDTIIRNLSDAEDLKKAGMCYALGLSIFLTFLVTFMDAQVISNKDGKLDTGPSKSNLLSCFPLASPEQRAEINRLGTQMFTDMQGRTEPNVVEWRESLKQLTWITAMNWEGKKVSEDVMIDLL